MERFDLIHYERGDEMEKSVDGEWVRFEDVEPSTVYIVLLDLECSYACSETTLVNVFDSVEAAELCRVATAEAHNISLTFHGGDSRVYVEKRIVQR